MLFLIIVIVIREEAFVGYVRFGAGSGEECRALACGLVREKVGS
jgi:hypothetical protein